MVRRVLQDHKVPGTSAKTREVEAPGLVPEGLLQDSWERGRLGCVRGQVLGWTCGLKWDEIFKKKKKRGTRWLFGEFSTAAATSYAPIAAAPGSVHTQSAAWQLYPDPCRAN